ncbi:hypothetical protein AUC69_03310 [Methyloceanibacter superfactus]|uniref:Uncharacterized protein n=1 Tax=Methyloceanibacter superfactus TaxID=1774969 RepID=A0A1E3VPH5_9HYPH|nr:hypothetical protein AUC69_03310 [Methyloceanibacter superfactus]
MLTALGLAVAPGNEATKPRSEKWNSRHFGGSGAGASSAAMHGAASARSAIEAKAMRRTGTADPFVACV